MKKIIQISALVIFSILLFTGVSSAQNNAVPKSHDALIYPNPITDCKMKVKSENIMQSVEIINVVGQSIMKKEIVDNNNESVEMELTDCEKGMYLVKITFNDNKSIIKKLLIK